MELKTNAALNIIDKADYFGNAHSAGEVHAMSLGNLHGEYATVVNTAQIL
jgi:hypothetical protein